MHKFRLWITADTRCNVYGCDRQCDQCIEKAIHAIFEKNQHVQVPAIIVDAVHVFSMAQKQKKEIKHDDTVPILQHQSLSK